jgi:hypothetical protein
MRSRIDGELVTKLIGPPVYRPHAPTTAQRSTSGRSVELRPAPPVYRPTSSSPVQGSMPIFRQIPTPFHPSGPTVQRTTVAPKSAPTFTVPLRVPPRLTSNFSPALFRARVIQPYRDQFMNGNGDHRSFERRKAMNDFGRRNYGWVHVKWSDGRDEFIDDVSAYGQNHTEENLIAALRGRGVDLKAAPGEAGKHSILAMYTERKPCKASDGSADADRQTRPHSCCHAMLESLLHADCPVYSSVDGPAPHDRIIKEQQTVFVKDRLKTGFLGRISAIQTPAWAIIVGNKAEYARRMALYRQAVSNAVAALVIDDPRYAILPRQVAHIELIIQEVQQFSTEFVQQNIPPVALVGGNAPAPTYMQ